MTQGASIRIRQLKQEHHVVPEEHVRRLDVGPVDRSTYRQKASGRGLGHRAKMSGYCAKDIGVLTCGLCNSLENIFKIIVSTLIRVRIRC